MVRETTYLHRCAFIYATLCVRERFVTYCVVFDVIQPSLEDLTMDLWLAALEKFEESDGGSVEIDWVVREGLHRLCSVLLGSSGGAIPAVDM